LDGTRPRVLLRADRLGIALIDRDGHCIRPNRAASTAHPGASPGATYPNIPPTDYTFPYFGSTPYFGSGSSAPSQALTTPVWSAVDWSVLGATDPHSGWGFTAALMPSPNANAASPTTNWVDAGSPPAYASVPLVRGRYAYAIAVTWPADLNVTGLTFVYLAPPRSPHIFHRQASRQTRR